jgi:hypothetical protein
MAAWEVVRAQLVAGLHEASAALESCTSEDDLMLVLDVIARYPALARADLHASRPAARVTAMRAAVTRMREVLDVPVQPVKPPKEP